MQAEDAGWMMGMNAAIYEFDADDMEDAIEAGKPFSVYWKEVQEYVRELDRVELPARRVDRFTREEARLLVFPDHQLRGCGQPMGFGGHEGDAGGSVQGPKCWIYAGGFET